jgi:hypothetical protein
MGFEYISVLILTPAKSARSISCNSTGADDPLLLEPSVLVLISLVFHL